MVWVIVAIIAIVIFIWLRRMSSPEVASKSVARTQLMSLQGFRRKYPSKEIAELIVPVIKTRPGYDTDEKIEALIDFARQLSIQKNGPVKGYASFMWIVVAMCVIEQNQGKKQATGELVTRIYRAVSSVIPEDME
jgi:hypothetical protein